VRIEFDGYQRILIVGMLFLFTVAHWYDATLAHQQPKSGLPQDSDDNVEQISQELR
jgi:hypothetical protein